MPYAPGTFSGAIIVAASNSIPVAFDASAGSRITGLRAWAHASFSHLQIINTTATLIGIATATTDDGIPSATGPRARCPGNYSITFDAGVGPALVLDNLFFQSESGSPITVGTIIVNLW